MLSAILAARAEYVNRKYAVADSNRFVALALFKAGIAVSAQARHELGWAPAFGGPDDPPAPPPDSLAKLRAQQPRGGRVY